MMIPEADIDVELLKEALNLEPSKTKEEVINQALKEYIYRREKESLSEKG